MKVCYLENLASSNVKTDELSNLILTAPSLPTTFKSKLDVTNWRESEHTKHVFFSPYEGVMKNYRVSKKGGANDPMVLHGFVADYDQSLSSEQEMLGLIQRNQSVDFPVSYAVRTYSGGAHLVWEFEKPVNILNSDMLKGFIELFAQRAKLGKIMGGLDTASFGTNLYYTFYSNWHAFSSVIQENMIEALLFEVGKNIKPFENEGPVLPWSVIQENIEQKFPGRWKGKFEEGARGIRFWDPTASHPNAAMLTSTGVAYFTDGGGFIPWGSSALFGPSVVAQYQANKVAACVKDIYCDDSSFYRRLNDRWVKDNRETIKTMLRVTGGLSSKMKKGVEFNEVDEALVNIQNNRRIDGMLPFVYNKNTIVRQKGKTFLNSSVAKCHPMTDNPVKWGQGFPFIAYWLEKFFYSKFQRIVWLSWLHHFYKNSYDGTPRAGQCMFVAGGTSKGKTLMNYRLLGGMMGGHTDIASYVTGDDNFNENLFEVGLGTVDDQLATSDYRAHLRYTALLKKLVANNVLSMRAMYKGAVDIDWCGRLSVTMNEDPESMRMLPDLDINNRDKVIILRCSPTIIDFPEDVQTIIAQEMAAFCRYIYDFKIPPECKGSARFGVSSYIDPHLRSESDYSSMTYATVEILNEWRESYFTANPSATEWFGTITRMVKELCEEFSESSTILKTTSPQSLTRHLTVAMNRNDWIKRDTRDGVQGFIIEKGKGAGIDLISSYEDEPDIDLELEIADDPAALPM